MLMLKDRMSRYFGQYHPFYDEIYELLTNYNMGVHKYEKALGFCKMALGNMIQLCGGNNMHEKLAGARNNCSKLTILSKMCDEVYSDPGFTLAYVLIGCFHLRALW